MRLLIYTQAVDTNEPMLGFFHRWLIELSTHFSHIHVVCLKEGKHELPPNITVHSLGKETGESRVKYIIRFYRHLLSLGGSYDAVFLHMNPHYGILGALYWKLTGIPMYFWRNHAKMNMMTRIVAPLAKRVFYTSPFACTARYAHAVQMPVGIDTQYFTVGKRRKRNEKKKILFLGRLSPVKRVELFLQVAEVLGDAYEFHVYGDAPSHDRAYGTLIKEKAPSYVVLHPGVTNNETIDIYHEHDIYLNLTPEGSMDKTVLEAIASGVPTVAVNRSFTKVLPGEWIPKTDAPEDIVNTVLSVLRLPEEDREAFVTKARETVVKEHSLHRLGVLLYKYIHG